MAAEDHFFDAQVLVFPDFFDAVLGAADDEAAFQYLVEGDVDAVGGGEFVAVTGGGAVLVEPFNVGAGDVDGFLAGLGDEHFPPS